MTYLVALMIWPDERLIVTQWFGSAVLVVETLLVLYTGRQKNAERGQRGASKMTRNSEPETSN